MLTKKTVASLAASSIAGGTLLLTSPMAVQNAFAACGPVTDPISVGVTKTDGTAPNGMAAFDVVRLQFSGTIADGHCSGDQFKFTLPSGFNAATGVTYPLNDAAGNKVANMVVTKDANGVQTVTVTLTDYVTTHSNVSVQGFLESKLTNQFQPNTANPVDITVNGKVTETVVTMGNGTSSGMPTQTSKGGSVRQRNADGTVKSLNIQVNTPTSVTANQVFRVTDTLGSGQFFDCAPLLEPNYLVAGQYYTGVDGWGVPTGVTDRSVRQVETCTPTEVTFTVTMPTAGTAGQFTIPVQVTPGSTGPWPDTAKVETNGGTFGATLNYSDLNGGGTGGGNQSVSLGDYVWLDADHDGIQDETERGIGGVKLTLTGPTGQPVTDITGKAVGPATTDANGKYLFASLPPLPVGQHYTVTVATPAGYVPTIAGAGTDRALDSSTGSSVSTDLTTNGAQDLTNDFGFWIPEPNITIVKDDAAGNAADTSDTKVDLGVAPGSTGLVMTITNNGTEDLRDIAVNDVTTDGTSGSVTGLSCDFSALDGPSSGTTWAGVFKVGDSFTCTATLTGVTTTEHVDTATVTGTGAITGTGVTADNPYHAIADAAKVSVGDYVWLDANHDGIQDSTEAGLPGAILTLTNPDGSAVTDVNGAPVAPITTGTDGKYTFADLPALPAGQHYTVTVTPPAGYSPTLPNVGDAATDSSTDKAESTDLVNNGDSDTTLDFGFWQPAPKVSIIKKDAAGNDADTAAEQVNLGASPATTGLVFDVTNSGTEDLKDITVSDATTGSGTVDNISCAFPDGTTTGTTWAGVFKVGATFQCTATLNGVTSDPHADTATVNGTGVTSGTPVTDSNEYHAVATKAKVSVGDLVWLDANHDGLQDPTEAGLPGAVLTLTGPDGSGVTDVNGNFVLPITTGSDGKYVFTDLPALPAGQQYTVTITPPAGYSPTLDGVGTDRAVDSSTDKAVSTDLTTDGASDLTLDFGFWQPKPTIDIEKTDAAGNDADTSADKVALGAAPATTGLKFTIANTGTEDLKDIKVSDVATGSGTVDGLSCTFPNGTTGVDWAGVFKVGDKFECTATLNGVTATEHIDTATVTGTGVASGTPVTDKDEYHADASTPKVSVGDYVWLDANHDGIQQGTEAGLPGAVLTLTNPDGSAVTDVNGKPVAPITTGADGKYTFTDLPALPAGQHYTVTVTPPAGYSPTLPNVGGDTAVDSSTDKAESTDLVTDGASDTTLDFGFWQPAPKVDIEKVDAQGNDADTVAETVKLGASPASTGIDFIVTNNGTEDLTKIAVTDAATGSGTLENLSCTFPDDTTGTTWDGTFKVGSSFKCTATLTGVTDTPHADTATVTGMGVASGTPVTDTDEYHAVATVAKVSVGDYVWLDADNNGVQDSTEKGIEGVTLTLTGPDGKAVTDVAGNPVAPVKTDATGKYSFTDLPVLPAGQHYTVTVTDPTGYTPTKANVGTDTAVDSSTGKAESTDLTKDGASDLTLDFGYWKPAPTIDIEKTDAAGNDADTSADKVSLGVAPAGTDLVMTVKNNGTEALKDIKVSDAATGSGSVANLSCDFSKLGGPATGTEWAGEFKVGDSFTCSAKLTGVTSTEHVDAATVTGNGVATGTPVTDTDEYHAIASDAKVSVGDYVWLDANHDGVQDATEKGIEGVTLTLVGPDGNPVKNVTGTEVAPTKTDASGKYNFDGLPVLPAGQHYTVKVTDPTGFAPTLANVGSDKAVDSSTGSAESGDLTKDGDRDSTLDFGYWAPTPKVDIEKTDAKGNDADTSAEKVNLGSDPANTDLVFTVKNNGAEDLKSVKVSDVASGSGTVDGLSCTFPDGTKGTEYAGVFKVGESFTCSATLTGVTVTEHVDSATVTGTGVITGTGVTDTDDYHAFADAAKVSVGDYVWLDADHDGVQDSTEKGIQGVTLTLVGPDGGVVKDVNGKDVAPTTTDASGKYTFDNLPVLPAGQHYTVKVTDPAGMAPTIPTVGTDRTVDSSTGSAESTDLTKDGQRDSTLDFGYWTPAPKVDIEKGDAKGNDADTSATRVNLGIAPASTDLVFTVKNNGSEGLKDVVVTDKVTGSGTVTGLSCTFPDGSKGTTWAGVFKVGDSFKCTAKLTGVTTTEHVDDATVTGKGEITGKGVTDTDGYHSIASPGKVSVGDYVWFDADKDGIQDKGEKGISGVTLTLTGPDGKAVKDVDGKIVAPVKTDGNGKYVFSNLPILPAGKHYTVAVSAPKSFIPTKAGAGSNRAIDSSTGKAVSTDLTKDGQSDMTLDFGFVKGTKTLAYKVQVDDWKLKTVTQVNAVKNVIDYGTYTYREDVKWNAKTGKISSAPLWAKGVSTSKVVSFEIEVPVDATPAQAQAAAKAAAAKIGGVKVGSMVNPVKGKTYHSAWLIEPGAWDNTTTWKQGVKTKAQIAVGSSIR